MMLDDSTTAVPDLFHIAQLIDQLRHDDNVLRVNAAKNVVKIGNIIYNFMYNVVVSMCVFVYYIYILCLPLFLFTFLNPACALGPERTRDELVPFIGGNFLIV